MADFDLVLQGTVVLPQRIIEDGYVAVSGGKIAEVGIGVPPAARERHLLGKALILPGAIDAQVHSLSQKDQEDFVWSTRSAAAGGVTTIVDMPYDEGNLVCSADAVKRKVSHACAAGARRFRALRHDRSGRRRGAHRAKWWRPVSPRSSSRPSAPIPSAFRAFRLRSSMPALPKSPRRG